LDRVQLSAFALHHAATVSASTAGQTITTKLGTHLQRPSAENASPRRKPDQWSLRRTPVRGRTLGTMSIRFEPAIPILRIFDVDRARGFYVDWLGFTVDWE